MEEGRKQAYEELESKIGGTPLVKYEGDVPNGNTIWIKRECDNPFGSHYDRVYLALFRHFEENEGLKPGDNALETTSGTAGVSFAGIGRLLGYTCYVMIPDSKDLEKRAEAIEREGGITLPTQGDYVNGFTRSAILRNRKKYGATFLNHSMGKGNSNNEITLSALEGITNEAVREIDVDIFIPAVGNGSSVLGPGRILDGIRIVGYETAQSAVAYDMLNPGRYKEEFGIEPGTLSRHRLPGTSYRGIDFPHIQNAVKGNILDQVVLVSCNDMNREYQDLTGRTDLESLPRFDITYLWHEDLGKSTNAGISVTLDLAKEVEGKNMLVIGYDKADRY